MNDQEFLRKLHQAFAMEAEEHLQAMTSNLLDLEKTSAPDRKKEIVEIIFREAHSLKGAAHAVKRTDIESVCQALESVFASWKRRGAVEAAAETFDVLGSALDFAEELLAQPGVATEAPAQSALQEIVRRLTQLNAPVAGSAPAAPAQLDTVRPTTPSVPPPELAHHESERQNVVETVRVPTVKMDELLLRAEGMLGMKMLAGQHLVDLRELGMRIEQWRKEWGKLSKKTRAAKASVLPGEKLHQVLEWNESRLHVLDGKLVELTKAAERNQRIVGSLVDDLLDDAKRLAMQPFARMLDTVPKQVRDLAREQGKEVEVVIHGQEFEIDKRILDEMKTPFIHLVRNAIDHGIEKPDVRRQLSKPACGLLTIAVSQRDGDKLEILVSDDGAGIDLAKVKVAAVKSELIGRDEADHLSESSALALIFQSGVSTSPILTEISGRGLGMAIVREKVEKLGGQISIEMKPDIGTTFRMVLPVTLAIFKGILVRSGGQTFVIPTSSVERITRVKRDEIKTVENRETVNVEGRPLSLAWLADMLELPRIEPEPAAAFVEVFILRVAERRLAFAVEEVIDEQEVLVKNLNKPLVRVRNIAGATVLPSGKPILILNAVDLLQTAIRMAAGGGARRISRGATPEVARVFRILVADDSVTSRMLLKNILQSAGYQVTTAVDGVDAFTALRSGEFDLVVTDVEMPRMDGFDLTSKIRADPASAELPVVLVTALSSREDQERGIDVGANAYIVKSSFDQSDLLAVIRNLL
jgi:two-component system chemotaxis sensor kinase CheA